MPQDVWPLREWRARRELTVRELAKIAGCAPDTVVRIESGRGVRLHAGTVGKLTRALNIEPWQLEEWNAQRRTGPGASPGTG